MTTVNFSDYTWFTPRPKASPMAITIPNLTCMNFNQKAMLKMPTHIVIGVSKDGSSLCVREPVETGYKLPKSGTIKDKELVSHLVSLGIRLPARYALREDADCWIAELTESNVPKVAATGKKRRISKNTAETLIKEINSL